MFKRLLCNKYVLGAELMVRNIMSCGIGNTLNMYRRDKMTDYGEFKKSFANEAVFDLIDKGGGGDLDIKTAFDMGFCIYGPLIYDFVKWLDWESQGYSQLLFLSREGWLLKKAFDIYSEKSNISCYFLASRRAVSVAAIEHEKDIKDILSIYYRGSFKNIMYSRLGIDYRGKDFYTEMPGDIDKVHIDTRQILNRAREEKARYKDYCKRTIKEGNTAVVDIGYSGTIQLYLSRLLNKAVDGLYMSFHYSGRAGKYGCKCKSLFPVYNMLDEGKNKIFRNQLYLEAVLKAPYGQLICFDEKGQPVYNNDSSFDNTTEEIQEGILSFVKTMKEQNIDIGMKTLSAELFDFAIRNNKIDISLIKKLSVEDSYCSDKELTVVQ